MFRLDKLIKRLLSLVKHYIRVLGWLGKDTQSAIQQAYQEIQDEISQRHAHKRGIDLEQYPKEQARMYRTGYWVMLLVLGLTLVLFVFQGSFEREWINPYSPSGQAALQALHPNQLSVALLGATGLPPFVIGLSVLLFLVGWFFMLQGLQTAHPSYSVPFCLVLTGQLWLLSSGVPAVQSWLPYTAGSLHFLLCWLGYRERRNRALQLAIVILHLFALSVSGYHILFQAPSRMSVMLGLSAAQFSTILMLVAYWYLLGRDALDGSVTLGQWYGFVTLRLLGGFSLTILTLVLLVAAAFPYLARGTFLVPFGVAVLLGCVALVAQWLRQRRPPGLLAVNLFLLSLLLLVIAPRAMSAYFPKGASTANLFGILSPVLLYIYTTIWSFYSSGPLFVNRANSKLPASSRLFLHMGWVLVATNCLMFFVAARDKVFAILSLQITAEAFLAVGVPFFLYLLYRSWRVVFIDKLPHFAKQAKANPGTEQSEAGEQPKPVPSVRQPSRSTPIPGVAFVMVGLVLLLSIHAVRGLSVVNFAKVAYYTATGNLALRSHHYRRAIVQYDRALQVSPKNYKPYSLKAAALQVLGKNDAALAALRTATTLESSAIDPWLQYGALLRQKNRYKEALQAYKQAEKLDPSDSFTYRNMALCYSYMGKHQAAMQNMRKALRLMPGTNEFGNTHYPAFGAILMRAQKYPKAKEVLQTALRYNPNDHLAHFDLGLLYQKPKLRNLKRAWYHLRKSHRLRPELIAPLSQLAHLTTKLMKEDPRRKARYLQVLYAAYEHSMKKSPDDSRIVSRYVETSLQHKAFEQAERLLPALRKRTQLKPLLQMLEARIAMRQKQYKKADRYLKALLERKPNDFDTLYYQGQSYHMQGRYKEAESFYDKAMALRPNYKTGLYNQIVVLRNLKKYKAAEAVALHLVKAHPGNEQGLFQLGLLQQIQKKPKQALVYYQKILTNNPNHLDAIRNTAVAYYAMRQCAKAIPYYKRYFAKATRPTRGMFAGLSECYQGQRKYGKANKVYRALAKHYPRSFYPYYMIGLNFQRMGKYKLARKNFQAALQRKPGHYSSMLNVAMGYRFERRYPQAMEATKALLKIRPNDPNAMLELAFVAKAQNNYKLAIQHVKKLLDVHPKATRGWNFLSLLYSRTKQYKKAYQASLQWLKLSPNNYYALRGITAYEMFQTRQYKRVFRRCIKFLRARQNIRHRSYLSLLYRCAWAARKQKPAQMKIAMILYKRILRYSRRPSVYVLTELAQLHGLRKQRKQQLKLLQQAVKRRPQLFLLRFDAAYQQYKNGNKALGRKKLARIYQQLRSMTPAQYKRHRHRVRSLAVLRPPYNVLRRFLHKLFQPPKPHPASKPSSHPAQR